jgi:hypothetical protein
MAKLDFAAKAAEPTKPDVTAPEETNSETAVIPAPERQVAAAPSYESDVEGEISERDIKRPRLYLVQKTSTIVKSDPDDESGFNFGDWVVNKDTHIGTAKKAFKVVVAAARKVYQEYIPFGTGDDRLPRTWRTAAEVREAGFTTEWGTSTPRAAEVLHALLWIPQPEGIDAPHVFSMEGPDGPGALVVYTASGTAYSGFGKAVLTAASTGHLTKERGGLISGLWELTASLEKKENKVWYQPRLRPAGRTSDGLQAFLREGLHKPAAE